MGGQLQQQLYQHHSAWGALALQTWPLMPGEKVTLHIYEEKYVRLIEHVMQVRVAAADSASPAAPVVAAAAAAPVVAAAPPPAASAAAGASPCAAAASARDVAAVANARVAALAAALFSRFRV